MLWKSWTWKSCGMHSQLIVNVHSCKFERFMQFWKRLFETLGCIAHTRWLQRKNGNLEASIKTPDILLTCKKRLYHTLCLLESWSSTARFSLHQVHSCQLRVSDVLRIVPCCCVLQWDKPRWPWMCPLGGQRQVTFNCPLPPCTSKALGCWVIQQGCRSSMLAQSAAYV